MKKHLFWIASIALGAVACTDKDMAPEDVATPAEPGTEQTVTSNLQTAKLATFKSSQDRVTLNPETRDGDEIKTLELIAEIGNLSQEGKISGFVQETGGRYLSATCVFYDQTTGTFYTTYHMQGNNYNTTQTNETGGFIETFTLDENDKPEVGGVYMAADPSNLSFDFNHLYFDDLSKYNFGGRQDAFTHEGHRIIAVGHSSEAVKTGSGFNTKAIIGKIDFEKNELQYAPILTGEKIYQDGVTNKDGSLTSLGDEDAGDANCVIRKANFYYVATRKGLAVVEAADNSLFAPIHDYESEKVYFIKTPGSAKFLSHEQLDLNSSHFSMLYLTENTPKDFGASTSINANIARFSVDAGSGRPCHSNTSQGTGDIRDTESFNILDWWENTNLPEVKPIDGKNVTFWGENNSLYACLGTGGLYAHNPYDNVINRTVKLSDAEDGSRPVNGLFVESIEYGGGRRLSNGFIYVANGACLTILDGSSLETIAEYSAFDSKADTNLASANYVHVVKSDKMTNGVTPDRIVTVAYGQEGVKVFRFVPPVK